MDKVERLLYVYVVSLEEGIGTSTGRVQKNRLTDNRIGLRGLFIGYSVLFSLDNITT